MLVREELASLYSNRAQTYVSQQMWPEGWIDAFTSIKCNEDENGKAWYRGGKCLVEMSRWEEAESWVERGLAVEEADSDAAKELKGLMEEIQKGLGR